MPLNSCEAHFFDKIAHEQATNEARQKPLAQCSLAELRANEQFLERYTPTPAAIPTQDYAITVRDGASIKLRLFNVHLPANTPVLLMYPGCGYFLRLFEINASACSRIARGAKFKVAMVDLRVCPEVTMPTPIDDAYDVAKAMGDTPERFGIDSNKIYVGGMSSGAHAATAVAYLLANEDSPPITIQHQFLLNGFFDYANPRTRFAEYEQFDALCKREITTRVVSYYGLPDSALSAPLISPLHNPDMSSLPPTTVIVGEYDGLRSDSEDYYQALKRHGVAVKRIVLPGQTHNTFLMRDVLHEGPDPATVVAEQVSHHLLSE